MNVNLRIARANFTGYASGIIASFTGLRAAPTKIRVNAIGVSECNVVRCGVNAWDEEWVNGYRNVNTGAIVSNPDNITNKNLIRVTPNTTYFWKTSGTGSNYIIYFDANRNYIGKAWKQYNSTFTTPNNCYFVAFSVAVSTYTNDISINYPSTDTDYHAYTCETYTIPVNQTVTQIDQRIGVNNIFVDDENVNDGTVEVYFVTI